MARLGRREHRHQQPPQPRHPSRRRLQEHRHQVLEEAHEEEREELRPTRLGRRQLQERRHPVREEARELDQEELRAASRPQVEGELPEGERLHRVQQPRRHRLLRRDPLREPGDHEHVALGSLSSDHRGRERLTALHLGAPCWDRQKRV